MTTREWTVELAAVAMCLGGMLPDGRSDDGGVDWDYAVRLWSATRGQDVFRKHAEQLIEALLRYGKDGG